MDPYLVVFEIVGGWCQGNLVVMNFNSKEQFQELRDSLEVKYGVVEEGVTLERCKELLKERGPSQKITVCLPTRKFRLRKNLVQRKDFLLN